MDEKYRKLLLSRAPVGEGSEEYQYLQPYISSAGKNYVLGIKSVEPSVGMAQATDWSGFQYFGAPEIQNEQPLITTIKAADRLNVPNQRLRELGMFHCKEFIDQHQPKTGTIQDPIFLDIGSEKSVNPPQERVHVDEEHRRYRERVLLALDDAYKQHQPPMVLKELMEQAWLSELQLKSTTAYLKSKDWIEGGEKSWEITGYGTDEAERLRKAKSGNGGNVTISGI